MADRVDAMRAFVLVCDSGGFSKAARMLRTAPSTVTKLVSGLEERLGVRLLQRSTRAVRATQAGTKYLERARQILEDVAEAELIAQKELTEPLGKLVVAAPEVLGRLHLAPIVARYLQRYPKVNVELRLVHEAVNIIGEGIDVAIHVGELRDSALVARRLGGARRVFAASPAYLRTKDGPPRDPHELTSRFDLLAIDSETEGPGWNFAHFDRPLPHPPGESRVTSNSPDVAIACAVAGQGIIAAYSYQVADLLRSGQLVALLDEFTPPCDPIQAVFPGSRTLSIKVRAFVDALQREARHWDVETTEDVHGSGPILVDQYRMAVSGMPIF